MTRYIAANMAWQLGGDAWLLRALAGRADVLNLVECRDRGNKAVDVAATLGPSWLAVQDLSSGARAGCAFAVRRSSGVRVRRHRLRLASPAGPGVQARYLLIVTLVDNGERTRLIIGHRPLEQTGRQDEFDRVVRRVVRRARFLRRLGRLDRWALVGDVNEPPRQTAARLKAAHVFGADVMAFIYSAGWGRVFRDAYALRRTDHHVLVLATTDRKETPAR